MTLRSGPIAWFDRLYRFFVHVGKVAFLTRQTFVTLVRARLDWRAFLRQMDSLGVGTAEGTRG